MTWERDLKPGTRRAIEIEPCEGGRLRITHRLRVGNSGSRDLAPAKVVGSETEALAAIEIWAQEEQARIGLTEVRRR